MPEEKKTKAKPKKTKSSLVGSIAQPTVLSKDPKIGIDTAKTFVDNIIEAGVNGGLNMSDLESFTMISNARDKIYQLIDTMSQDSTVSAIVKTYAEDVCAVADNGHVMWCESDDPNISKYVNYLLNIMNVDKNLYKWAYCLIKYGDVYLRLYRESDYEDSLFSKDSVDNTYSAKNVLNEDYKKEKELDESVRLNMHKASDAYSYYVEMVDDPSSMYELDKYGKTYGYIETPNAELANLSYLDNIAQDPNITYANYRFKSGDVNIYQADDFVHACLDDNFTRYPEKVSLFISASDFDANTNAHSYSVKRGKSLLYDSYKVWREKSLLENSVLLNRITRSSILRKVSVEVGDMPKEQVSQVLHRVKDMMENKTAMNKDVGMSEYNNAAPIENFIYFATHNGQGAITVDSVGGDVNVKDLADLDTWINKFYSSYGIPKQYFGWCLAKDTKILLLDGTTHTIEELFNNKDKFIGKGIMACNTDGSLKPTTITNIMLTNEHAKLLRVWLDNGKYVDVTPDHRMMLRNGEFVEAKDLKENDSLMPYYDRVEKGRRMVLDNKTGKWIYQYQHKCTGLTDYEQVRNNSESHPDTYLKLATLQPKLSKLESYVPEVNHRVVKIEPLGDDNVVYDLSVAADCHTFALPCGIFVHNCDDGAGFNGGTALTIISSVYSKGVVRIQNSLIQAITDAINLFLLQRGYRSYLNNFTLKMKAPVTQEEISYRESLSNKITAISNMNGLFSEVEDKVNKLSITKTLVKSLDYGDELVAILDKEIAIAEEAKKKEKQAAEEEAKAAAEEEAAATAEANQTVEETSAGETDEDTLGLSSVATVESLDKEDTKTASLNENILNDDSLPLPNPDELDENIDFSENN